MKSPARSARAIIVVFLISSFVFVAYGHLYVASGGYVLNAYPYIPSDGFDWLTEGVYLHLRLLGRVEDVVLPVLRPPVFVLVTTIDAFLGQTGAALWTTMALSWLLTLFCLFRLTGYEASASGIAIVFGFLSLQFLNVFRFYVFADSLAIAFGLLGYFLVHKALSDPTLPRFGIALLTLVVAGLTQVYAVIPGIVFLGIRFLFALWHHHYRAMLPPLILAVSTGGVLIGMVLLWRGAIPHESAPNNFSILRFSTGMTGYYFHVLTLVWAPLIPGIISLVFHSNRNRLLRDDVWLSACAIVITMATLSYFYQWGDARFTFIYWPYVVLLLLRGYRCVASPLSHPALLLSVLLLFLQATFFSPSNKFTPRWDNVGVGWSRSWLQYVPRASSIDRLNLSNPVTPQGQPCFNATKPQNLTPYQTKIFKLHMNISPKLCSGQVVD